ncbi:SOUL heme-binding protein [Pseudoscourfieldia marina]
MSARVSCVARVPAHLGSARARARARARPPRASSFSRVLASSSSSSSSSSFDVLFAYPSGLLPSLGLAAASRVSTFLMEVPADLETIPSRIIYRKGAFFEVRALEAYVAAEANMESGKIAPGVVGDAVNSGNAFNTVASYIFGGNETNEAISMTTPVLSDAGAADENQRKSMRFVMAPTRVQETSTKPLPKPTNERVKLVDVPQRMVAVERFSGVATPQAVRWATEQLVENLRAVSNAYVPADEAARAAVRDGDIDALERLGVIETAQYNPPSTPPFRRTNELWLDVIVASANQV